jgi:hypothetical protein
MEVVLAEAIQRGGVAHLLPLLKRARAEDINK